MFESKYSKYVTYNDTRFAEEDEILSTLSPSDKGSGVPLYEKDGVIYVDDRDNHSIVIGGTGCGKTRASCKVAIRSVIENGESAIINDPKGELYRATVTFALSRNYRIRVLNLRTPEKSHHWNPLHLIYHYYTKGNLSKAQQAIDDFCSALMCNTISKNDRYWDATATAFLSRIIEMCMYFSASPSHFTLENILPLCAESSRRNVVSLMNNVSNISEDIRSALDSVVSLDAERTRTCVYSVLQTGLNNLVKSSSLLTLFNSNEIDFYSMAYTPSINYVIYPDEKETMNNVVKAFLTQAYTALIDVCDEQPDDKLPVRMNFILDEFSNLTPVDKFDNRISESRSKNIRYHLYCQSMNQLSEKYGESVAETILSNCTSWTCFSSKETKFLNSISNLCGTVYDFNGREQYLISPSELQFLSKGEDSVEVLILRQGVRPYVTNLPYYDKVYETDPFPPEIKPVRTTAHVRLSAYNWEKLAVDYNKKHKELPPRILTPPALEESEEDTTTLQGKILYHFGPISTSDQFSDFG